MPEQEHSPEELFVTKIIDDINYYQMEFGMTMAQILGCLNIITHEILEDIANANRDQEE